MAGEVTPRGTSIPGAGGDNADPVNAAGQAFDKSTANESSSRVSREGVTTEDMSAQTHARSTNPPNFDELARKIDRALGPQKPGIFTSGTFKAIFIAIVLIVFLLSPVSWIAAPIVLGAALFLILVRKIQLEVSHYYAVTTRVQPHERDPQQYQQALRDFVHKFISENQIKYGNIEKFKEALKITLLDNLIKVPYRRQVDDEDYWQHPRQYLQKALPLVDQAIQERESEIQEFIDPALDVKQQQETRRARRESFDTTSGLGICCQLFCMCFCGARIT